MRPARSSALLLVALVFAAIGALPTGPPRAVTYPIRAMGTYVNVTLVTRDSTHSVAAATAAHIQIRLVDSLMSNWTTTSEVARLNREADSVTTVVEPHVYEVIARSLDVWRGSEHAFDITVEPLVRAWGFIGGPRRVPSEAEVRSAFARVGADAVVLDSAARTVRFTRRGTRIDLGGIAKGYAVDLAARALVERGVRDALVDASGNMRALGHPPTSTHWRIGLRDPRDRMAYFARVWLADGEAISTSADYEQFVAEDGKRYGHILDARTGRPAEGILAVTVIATDATTSDAWDTPLFILGVAGARAKALERADIAAMIVVPGDGVDTVWVESSIAERFTLEPSARTRFIIRVFEASPDSSGRRRAR